MDLSGTRFDIAKKLKEYVESKRNKDGTAISAAFVKDGELVAAFACGTQDGNPENPATVHDLYKVGSVSKVYCTLAVMRLVEMGKVSLDTPVTEYLPRFTMKDKRYKQITLRMCLNHSSGLPGTNLNNINSLKWRDKGVYDQLYDYFAKSKLKADPGDYSVYCNDGFMLAEMVIAEVSGVDFTRFLQENITKPAGCLSTCLGESNSENRVLIREKGKPSEYIMYLGAGGIFTDLSDCAKIGYLFIDSKGIFKPESLNETARLEGKSFIANIAAENYGLGWDSVNLTNIAYDFGENTLAKRGGTPSFSSYLLVIKKYNLAAAISVTRDNMINPEAMLCDLCGMLLDEYNINTRKEMNKETRDTVKIPIPVEYAEKHSGMYYNNMEILRVSFDADSLKIQRRDMGGDGWKDFIKGEAFDSRRFVSGEMSFMFEEHRGSTYLIQDIPNFGIYPIAQKCKNFPPLNSAWKNRIGKKYIVCDANPNDIMYSDVNSLMIQEFEQEGILSFINMGEIRKPSFHAVPAGDMETEMFLNAPGMGSREGFAPFIYEKDGIEYLYTHGFNFIDSAYLKPLQTGPVISEKGEHNRVYSITAGNKLNIKIPTGVRIIILNFDLNRKYDSASGQELPETCDGYILFINEGPMNISVEVVPR